MRKEKKSIWLMLRLLLHFKLRFDWIKCGKMDEKRVGEAWKSLSFSCHNIIYRCGSGKESIFFLIWIEYTENASNRRNKKKTQSCVDKRKIQNYLRQSRQLNPKPFILMTPRRHENIDITKNYLVFVFRIQFDFNKGTLNFFNPHIFFRLIFRYLISKIQRTNRRIKIKFEEKKTTKIDCRFQTERKRKQKKTLNISVLLLLLLLFE